MSADLVAFFRARLDEIEARENGKRKQGNYYGKPCPVCVERFDPAMPFTEVRAVTGYGYGRDLGVTLTPCEHVVTWEEFHEWAGSTPAGDPFTLADVAAKREMLPHLVVDGHPLGHCDRCRVLRWLVRPFAGHEDYDEEWKP